MDTSRTVYKITSSSPGSEAAADAAAALAAASIVFKTADSTYSATLLSHSQSVRIIYTFSSLIFLNQALYDTMSDDLIYKKLFDLADKYRGSYQVSCPFYCSYSGYQVKTKK